MQFTASADIGRWLLWLIGLQFLSGISTVVFNWPLALAVLHNAGAALMVVLLTQLNYRVAMRGQTTEVRFEQTALTA
jgi:heme A synthase